MNKGGEAVLTLGNRGVHPVTWELAWPQSVLQVHPSEGSLSVGGTARVCVTSLQSSSHMSGPWRGSIHIYCDNTKDSVEVQVLEAPAVSLVPSIEILPRILNLGVAVIGSYTTGSLTLTNPGPRLVQWRASVEPSFFSLPQSSGLLNPSQRVQVSVQYRPAATGTHTALVNVCASVVQGGRELVGGPGNTVRLQGEGLPLKEAVATLPRPGNPVSAKKTGGGVSLESEFIFFPDTRVGEVSVAKMKIKNRSNRDQTVEIMTVVSESPFKIAQTTVDVKTGCYLNVPIQFRPQKMGEAMQEVKLRWEGNNILATLRGKAV